MKETTRIAYKLFREHLMQDRDYQEFKKNAVKKHYKEVIVNVPSNPFQPKDERINVVRKVEITIHYNVPDLDNSKTRKLNKLITL